LKQAGTFLLFAALAASLAAPAGAERRPQRRPGAGTANPSALIAAEIAFSRKAREDGQWTAFRDFADDEGVMFVPEPVLAKEWLSGRKDPPAPVQWEAYEVWMSCDGTLGVTKGGWTRPDGSVGYFTTIWKQREKKRDYRWVLDGGDALEQPLEKPEFLKATVADCRANEDIVVPARRPGELALSGMSDDHSLQWQTKLAPDGGRMLTVSIARSGDLQTVLQARVAPPAEAK
jgi:hypothetical protein